MSRSQKDYKFVIVMHTAFRYISLYEVANIRAGLDGIYPITYGNLLWGWSPMGGGVIPDLTGEKDNRHAEYLFETAEDALAEISQRVDSWRNMLWENVINNQNYVNDYEDMLRKARAQHATWVALKIPTALEINKEEEKVEPIEDEIVDA